jgi:hypothetical protein
MAVTFHVERTVAAEGELALAGEVGVDVSRETLEWIRGQLGKTRM